MFKLAELPTDEEINVFAEEFPSCDGPSVLAFLSVIRKGSMLLDALDRYMKTFGLLHGRFIALVVLQRNGKGEEKASDLARKMGIAKPTLTRMLSSLSEDGYITVTPCTQDKRARLVSLTEGGRELLRRVMPGYYELIHDVCVDLSHEQLSKITQLVGIMKEP